MPWVQIRKVGIRILYNPDQRGRTPLDTETTLLKERDATKTTVEEDGKAAGTLRCSGGGREGNRNVVMRHAVGSSEEYLPLPCTAREP